MFTGMAGGFFVTLGSAAVGCAGALYVERTAHRTLFRFFPHWYRDVEYAFGIEPHLLEAVRTLPEPALSPQIEEGLDWKHNSDWVEHNAMYAERSSQQIEHHFIGCG